MVDIINKIKDAVMSGQADQIQALVKEALAADVKASDILKEGFIAVMDEVGEKMSKDEIFIPEVLAAAKTMQTGLDLLKPYLVESESEYTGKVVIGSVKGDVHDIGKNMVCMMFEGAGFEVIDLGVNVPDEEFVENVKNQQPQILALSSLYTPTMLAMKDVIDALTDAGLRDKVKIIVGGAPVTQLFADDIGADGYAPDASKAVLKAKELLGN